MHSKGINRKSAVIVTQMYCIMQKGGVHMLSTSTPCHCIWYLLCIYKGTNDDRNAAARTCVHNVVSACVHNVVSAYARLTCTLHTQNFGACGQECAPFYNSVMRLCCWSRVLENLCKDNLSFLHKSRPARLTGNLRMRMIVCKCTCNEDDDNDGAGS